MDCNYIYMTYKSFRNGSGYAKFQLNASKSFIRQTGMKHKKHLQVPRAADNYTLTKDSHSIPHRLTKTSVFHLLYVTRPVVSTTRQCAILLLTTEDSAEGGTLACKLDVTQSRILSRHASRTRIVDPDKVLFYLKCSPLA